MGSKHKQSSWFLSPDSSFQRLQLQKQISPLRNLRRLEPKNGKKLKQKPFVEGTVGCTAVQRSALSPLREEVPGSNPCDVCVFSRLPLYSPETCVMGRWMTLREEGGQKHSELNTEASMSRSPTLKTQTFMNDRGKNSTAAGRAGR